jgi:peroxiredoxin
MTTMQPPRTFALLFVAALFFAGCGAKNAETPETTATEDATLETASPAYLGKKAPDFALKTLDGKDFRLSDHRGNVVLINFWATWCGPCVIETPELVKMYNELHGKGFTVVGISLDEEGFEVVAPFAKEYEVSYPLVVDDGTVAEEFGGVFGLPTTYVLDKNGNIQQRFIGIFPTKEMRPVIEEMLAEPFLEKTSG